MTEYKLAEGKKIDFGINGWLDYCKEDEVEAERRGRDEMLAEALKMGDIALLVGAVEKVLELDGWKKR